jgi:hypothetical protein
MMHNESISFTILAKDLSGLELRYSHVEKLALEAVHVVQHYDIIYSMKDHYYF